MPLQLSNGKLMTFTKTDQTMTSPLQTRWVACLYFLKFTASCWDLCVPKTHQIWGLLKMLDTLTPGKVAATWADNIFKCISLNDNVWTLNKISLSRASGLSDNMAALVPIMAWCWTGAKPLSEAMLVCCTDAYMRYSTSMSWEHVNLGALIFSLPNRLQIFQYMGKIF